jgi:predicted ATPase with chaperone activity
MTTRPGGGLSVPRGPELSTPGEVGRVLDHPAAPLSLAEAGLPLDLVVQLALKTLHLAGDLTGTELGRRLGLRFPVIEPALAELREARHIEVVSGSMLGPSSYQYRILDAGRARAMLFLQQNQYVGVAPVPLAQYTAYLRAHHAAVPRTATRERVREACSHLVLSDRVIDSLGPAINAAHSLFVYGPPGNGKTAIAQSIRNLLDGDVAVPHAIAVEGQIVRIFDPVVHEPLPSPERESLIQAGPVEDDRWVRCRRPLVTVGGELTLDALELTYLPVSGFYRAPLQALANGGVLVIDDFGRQRVAPRDLLNRWIVPLESRIDYLTLQTGQKFELPFVTLVAFATNIRPRDLVDEAFLRRIRYKVFAESPSPDDYARIWSAACAERGVVFDRGLVDRVLAECYRPRRIPLRACHPRDLIDQALSLAQYRGETTRLTFTLLAAACDSYFVDDAEN